jgi:hypothetical protein
MMLDNCPRIKNFLLVVFSFLLCFNVYINILTYITVNYNKDEIIHNNEKVVFNKAKIDTLKGYLDSLQDELDSLKKSSLRKEELINEILENLNKK